MKQNLKSLARRSVVILAAAALPIVAVAAPAYADSETQKQVLGSSGCTKDLVRSGSGKAKLSASGYSYVDADAGKAVISKTKAKVSATSCSGTGDNGVSVGTLKVKMTWVVTSTGLGSCSFGLPSGFSCTIDDEQTVITKSYTCKDTSSCSKTSVDEFQVYPRPNYKILSVTYQQSYSAQQPKKDKVSGTTNQRRWNA